MPATSVNSSSLKWNPTELTYNREPGQTRELVNPTSLSLASTPEAAAPRAKAPTHTHTHRQRRATHAGSPRYWSAGNGLGRPSAMNLSPCSWRASAALGDRAAKWSIPLRGALTARKADFMMIITGERSKSARPREIRSGRARPGSKEAELLLQRWRFGGAAADPPSLFGFARSEWVDWYSVFRLREAEVGVSWVDVPRVLSLFCRCWFWERFLG